MKFALFLIVLLGVGFFAFKSCSSKSDKGTLGLPTGAKAASVVIDSEKDAEAEKEDVLTNVYRFRNRMVPAAALLSGMLPNSASGATSVLSSDGPSNSVVLRCAASELPALLKTMEALDVVGEECYVDAWMVFIVGDKVDQFEMSFDYTEGLGVGGSLSASNSGFGVVIPAGSLAIKFDMLKSSGVLEVLDRPQLRLASGEKAEVTTGEDVPFPVVTFSSGGGSSTGIEFKRVGLAFRVVPLFLPGNRVRLTVEAENGLLGAMQKIGDVEVPSISRQTVTTSATLGFDDAIVIGGLESVRKERRFGLLGESEKRRVGRLYVALVLRSGIPRAIVPSVGSPGEFDLPGEFDDSLLPPKGWGLDRLDSEIEKVERDIKRKIGNPSKL